MLQAALVFVFGAAIDVLYVALVTVIERKRPVQAALVSIALSALQLFGYMRVSVNNWLCVPFLLGMGLGAYISVRWLQR